MRTDSEASQRRKCTQTVKEVFSDFSDHSSIHGVYYLTEKDRSWFEKIWWITVLSVCIFSCGILITDAWNINPIIISFSEKQTPIWELPFPAVIVCPESLVQKEKLDLFQVIYDLESHEISFEDLSNVKKERLRALTTVCYSNLATIEFGNNTNCEHCLDILREIQIPPEDIFVGCSFRSAPIDCMQSFKELLTPTGVCYKFNGIESYRQVQRSIDEDLQVWSIDEGYTSDAHIDTQPRRASRAGIKFGLSLLLRLAKKDQNSVCSVNSGFSLLLRLPNEVPLIGIDRLDISMQQSVNIALKPKMMTTTENVKKYPVDKRQCYFSKERYLRFFNDYTQGNCELECEANVTIKYCDCLNFNFRKQPGIQICGPVQMSCYENIINELAVGAIEGCNCLPGCTTIVFESEITVSRLNISVENDGNDDAFEYTRITIYFRESEIYTSQRSEMYGTTDFLASCGGLLGLCLGMSVLSLLEVVYFCTIRLLSHRRVGSNPSTLQTLRKDREPLKMWWKIGRRLITDYSAKSTIQGLNYITNSDRPRIERSCWSLVFLISVFCCSSLIFSVYKRFDKFPVIVTFSEQETPISQIPFPAVTICPMLVSNVDTVGITDIYHKFKEDERFLYVFEEEHLRTMAAIAQVCDTDVFGDIDPDNVTNCHSCVEDLRQLRGELSDMIVKCAFIEEFDNCSEIFREVITEEGICYTFNGLTIYRENKSDYHAESENWTIEGGYKGNLPYQEMYPKPGSKFALATYMTLASSEYDYLCKGPVQGFKIYLHLPIEEPQVTKHYYLVPMKQALELTVSPNIVLTSKELRDYSVEKRECFFSDERYLRFYKHYTQNNCESECLTNFTLQKCGCLRFNMPTIPGIEICGIHKIRCCEEAKFKLLHLQMTNNLKQGTSGCNCLPGCVSISYDAEIYQSYFSERLTDSFVMDDDEEEYYDLEYEETFDEESEEEYEGIETTDTTEEIDEKFDYSNEKTKAKKSKGIKETRITSQDAGFFTKEIIESGVSDKIAAQKSEKNKNNNYKLKVLKKRQLPEDLEGFDEMMDEDFDFDDFLNFMTQMEVAQLIVTFKASQVIASERSALYGKTEFLANIGGVLGLFLGFSIVSILELVYFFTVRLFCNIRSQLGAH